MSLTIYKRYNLYIETMKNNFNNSTNLTNLSKIINISWRNEVSFLAKEFFGLFSFVLLSSNIINLFTTGTIRISFNTIQNF